MSICAEQDGRTSQPSTPANDGVVRVIMELNHLVFYYDNTKCDSLLTQARKLNLCQCFFLEWKQ